MQNFYILFLTKKELCKRDGQEGDYMSLIEYFVKYTTCMSKTKEMVVDFHHHAPWSASFQ